MITRTRINVASYVHCLVLFRCCGVTSANVARIKEKPEGARIVYGRETDLNPLTPNDL
jgi:hypothetical protein